jgi:hypothetical protein
MQKQLSGPFDTTHPSSAPASKPKASAKALRAPGLTLRRKLEGPKRRAH